MIALIIYAFIVGVVAIGAALGFLLAIYLFRPHQFLNILNAFGEESSTSSILMLGFTVAILIPIVGGLAYALNGSEFLTTFLGEAGNHFLVWVGVAFSFGLTLGSFLRTNTSQK